MSDRDEGPSDDAAPLPTPRQLVVRAICTALILAALVAGVLVVLDQRNGPADVSDLVEEPRTVSYGQLSLQIPSDWLLNDIDECGNPQDDTLILGNAGDITCSSGERDDETTDVVMSSLTGGVVAPSPDITMESFTLPTGLRARKGTSEPAIDPDDPLRTTVLEIPALDVKVVATSPDQALVNRILATAKQIPFDSRATRTVAYLSAAIDVPRSWTVNDVVCQVPQSDTVVAGHPGLPRQTSPADEPCPVDRPPDVTDITLDSTLSEFGLRWGVIANESVTLLGGVKGVRGTKTMPDGTVVTVLVVQDLRAIAVARSSNQPLVDSVLSTVHRAVPPQSDEEQTPPTPTPDPTPRATMPSGVETRPVSKYGITMDVPKGWSRDDIRCDVPQSNTVALGIPINDSPTCQAQRAPGVSDIIVNRLYGDFGSLWMPVADEPFTLESGLSGLRGSATSEEGLPTTVLAFPTHDVVVVATAGYEGAAADLMDGILATIRVVASTQPAPPR